MGIREGFDFLVKFLRHPTLIGALWPSSRRLARRMVGSIDWARVQTVVEYGPGTGVFTREALDVMRPGTRLIAIERQPDLAARLRARFPEITVHEGDVADVRTICEAHGVPRVDAIISGLPWALFPAEQQNRILDRSVSVLGDGGQFVTFAYLQGLLLPAGRRFRHTLRERFLHVGKSPIEWFNLPPAFVYRCRR